MAPNTPLLDTIKLPADLRELDGSQLAQVCDELRAEMISAVSVTGGHLGAGLGVVELTVALHYVFNTPTDKVIWDVGHQAYPHKILTGRRDRIRTLRQGGGLSGFTKRAESEYDPFGAAHASTSISAGLGFAVARDKRGENSNVIAVIGDGSMSAGMAYEAMNNAAETTKRLIVILNDNDMSIAPPVGGLSAYLARLVSSREFMSLRDLAKTDSLASRSRLEHAARGRAREHHARRPGDMEHLPAVGARGTGRDLLGAGELGQSLDVDVQRIEEAAIARVIRARPLAILQEQRMQRIHADERAAGACRGRAGFAQRGEVAHTCIARTAQRVEMRGEAEPAATSCQRVREVARPRRHQDAARERVVVTA